MGCSPKRCGSCSPKENAIIERGLTRAALMMETVDPSNWMKYVIDNSMVVAGIVFPASHNSATYKMKNILASRWARCQTLTITKQLAIGIRMLDFRICDDIRKHEGDLWVSHYFRAIPLAQCLEEVRRFLDDHPSELVVIRLDPDSDRILSNEGFIKTTRLFFTLMGDLLVNCENVTTCKVGDLRENNRRLILSCGVRWFRLYESLDKSGLTEEERIYLEAYVLKTQASWSQTRSAEPERLAQNLRRFIIDRETQRPGKNFVIAEMILTHELNNLIRYPLSSIERKNRGLAQHWSTVIHEVREAYNPAGGRSVNAIASDFVNGVFCSLCIEINRTNAQSIPGKADLKALDEDQPTGLEAEMTEALKHWDQPKDFREAHRQASLCFLSQRPLPTVPSELVPASA